MMVRFLCVAAVSLVTQSAMATPAPGPYPELDFNAISVQVRDANNDGHFNLYAGGADRSYVAGVNGRAYKLIVRNRTGAPVLVVPSVDGVNVLTGKTASPNQSGYIVPAHGQVSVDGWRKTTREVAQFYFTERTDSYAARTGRPTDVGVIGLAVFRQALAPRAESITPMRRDRAELEQKSRDASEGPASAADGAFANRAPAAPSLGTGHGDRQRSEVTYQDFQRESATPFEVAVIEYDSLENLWSRGLVARPPVSRRPNPFPRQEFVPDPPPRY